MDARPTRPTAPHVLRPPLLPRLPRAARYAIAVLVTAVALGLTLLTQPVLHGFPFIWFFAAVVVSAWAGGLGGGLLSTVLSVLATDYFIIAPVGALRPASPTDVLPLGVFALVATLISSLTESLRGAERRATRKAREAGELASELHAKAAELEAANRRLRESSAAQLAEAQRVARMGSWEWLVAPNVVTWSDEMYRVYGYEPGALAVNYESFLARVHPDDVTAVRAAVQHSFRTGEPFEFDHRVVRADGSVRTLHATGAVEMDAGGAAARMFGTGQDVTEQRLGEAAAREVERERAARAEAEAARRRLADVFESIDDAVSVFDEACRYTYINGRAAARVRALGRDPAALLGRVAWEAFPELERTPYAAALRRASREQVPVMEVYESALDPGVWLEVRVFPTAEGLVTYSRDVTERLRAELARILLADAGETLAGSLDHAATLERVARLAVPRFADFAIVDLADDAGRLRPAAVAHRTPEGEALMRELRDRFPVDADPEHPLLRIVRGGEPALIADVDADAAALRGRGHGAEHRAMLRALEPRSCIVVPLRAGERSLGAISFCTSAASGRRYGEADLRLAAELGRRAALAVERSRLHAAERAARERAEQSADRTARLQAITAALSQAATPEEVAEVIVGESVSAMGAFAGGVALLADDGRSFVVLRAMGPPPAAASEKMRIPVEVASPITEAARERASVFVESYEAFMRSYPGRHPLTFENRSDGAWAALPLVVEQRLIGVLAMTWPAARAFGDEDRDFMEALAGQCAQALERARLYAAERAARAEAEAANRAKSEFLTTMSHELRTPLNAIAGYVQLLEMGVRGPVTEAQRQDLARIGRSQEHLLALINDVLNFARIEAGHVHYDVADVPLAATLAAVEAMVAPQLRAKSLAYEYRAPDPGLRVRADGDKVMQVVLNLLSNAVKFTAEGGRVTLDCLTTASTVAVRVADTGIGIPKEKLGVIFDPFVQVTRGYTRTAEGTGLGLAISRDLARAMHGDLTVESEPGVGSVFTFTLPRATGDGRAATSDHPASDHRAPAHSVAHRTPR